MSGVNLLIQLSENFFKATLCRKFVRLAPPQSLSGTPVEESQVCVTLSSDKM